MKELCSNKFHGDCVIKIIALTSWFKKILNYMIINLITWMSNFTIIVLTSNYTTKCKNYNKLSIYIYDKLVILYKIILKLLIKLFKILNQYVIYWNLNIKSYYFIIKSNILFNKICLNY